MCEPTACCPRCGDEKPLSEFTKDRSKASGYASRCKACDNARSKQRYYEIVAPRGVQTCQRCGGSFEGRKRKYCGRCKQINRVEPLTCARCGQPAVARSRYPTCEACQLVPCEVCGKPFKRRESPDRNGLIQRACSRECGWWIRYAGSKRDVPWRDCSTCGQPFISRCVRRTCSACPARSTPYVPAVPVLKPCAECAQDFVAVHKRARFCSKPCAKRAKNRSQRHAERAAGKRNRGKQRREQRQRAQRRGPPFTLLEIAIRDGWRCHLCGRKVTRRQASIDHLIPLVDGGPHSRDNVALAHHLCNSVRQDGGDVQLLLVG